MSEYADFDLDRSIAEAWALFAERLAEVISMIDDEGELTIGTMSASVEPAPWVRFVEHNEDGKRLLRMFASSNAELGEAFQLRVDQLEAMEHLGWHPATTEPPVPTRDFWFVGDQQDAAALAEMAVATLRDVFGVQHPVFLAPDQLAEVLQPGETPQEVPQGGGSQHASTSARGASARPGEDGRAFDDGIPDQEYVAVRAADRDELDALVTAELTELFGHEPIRDSEGDLAIRVGSSMVFVRITPDGKEIVLFSALVHDVEGRSRATEVLNDLNTESRFGRFALHRDRVFVSMSLFANPFVAAHLHQGLRVMSRLADDIDDELAAKLRGRTTFVE